MFLVSTRQLLIDAQKKRYAIPALNIHNLETIKAVVEVANEMKSPVILAATPSTIRFSGAEYLAEILSVSAKHSEVPIAYHLDHHKSLIDMTLSVKLGCKSVMIDASHLPYEENISKVKEVVDALKRFDVTVEAELGKLVGQEDDISLDDSQGALTDTSLAEDFVNRTGIDSLAVAIGTSHGLYKAKPKLDIERLIAIKNSVKIPLVLHGASGIPNEDLKLCIREGICKVNIATELKISFSEAIKAYFNEHQDESDPRKYLKPAKEAMKEVIREKILICGSNNRI